MAFLLYLRGHQPNDTSSIKRTAHETALTHTSLRQREQESLLSQDHKIHTHTHTRTHSKMQLLPQCLTHAQADNTFQTWKQTSLCLFTLHSK